MRKQDAGLLVAEEGFAAQMEGPDLQTEETKCRGRKGGKGVASISEQKMMWRPNSTQDSQSGGFGLAIQAEMVELSFRNRLTWGG